MTKVVRELVPRRKRPAAHCIVTVRIHQMIWMSFLTGINKLDLATSDGHAVIFSGPSA